MAAKFLKAVKIKWGTEASVTIPVAKDNPAILAALAWKVLSVSAKEMDTCCLLKIEPWS